MGGWKRHGWMLALLGVITLSSVEVMGQDFRPFTPVEDVCPECEDRPQDRLELTGGDVVEGEVVAENVDFYVVVRFQEVRTVPRERVLAIQWGKGDETPGLMKFDQILLPSGHVLSGTIIDDKVEPAIYKIKSSFNQQTYTVSKSEAQAVYIEGRAVEAGER